MIRTIFRRIHPQEILRGGIFSKNRHFRRESIGEVVILHGTILQLRIFLGLRCHEGG